MGPEDRREIDVLLNEGDAYRFVALFMGLPDDRVAEGVMDGSARDDLRAISLGLGLGREDAEEIAGAFSGPGERGWCEGLDTNEVKSALRRDYTAMFTNPEHPKIAVYEALYKGSDDFDTSQLTFVSPTAIDAESHYRSWGIAINPQHRDSPDHMGAEADFLGFLKLRQAECLKEGRLEDASRVEEEVASFRAKHFDKWAEGFFGDMVRFAQTPPYRGVALLGLRLAGMA